MPEDYTNEKEIEFFKYVPTTWDESHYLAGRIGEYISVARRKGDIWFVGSAAGLRDWNSVIKFDFLDSNTIYEDSDSDGISKRTIELKKNDTFPVNIGAKGGQGIILRPAKR